LLTVLFAAACGEVKGAQLDAKPADASHDAVDADLTGMATIITQSHFSGAAAVSATVGNIDVVSALPNGMVHDMGKTDTSGHMSLKVYPGGTVTAIYRHTVDAGADLVSYLGAQPNDTLTFGKYWAAPYANSPGAMTLSWTAYSGANQYNVNIPCGTYGFPNTTLSYASFNEYPQCDHEPMGVVGVAFNASNQVLAMNYSVFNFSVGGSQALSTFWQAASTATATFTGLPPEVTQLYAYYYIVTNGGVQGYGYGTNGTPTGGAGTITFPWVNTGERTLSYLTMSRNGSYYQMQILDAINALNVTAASPQLPPWNQGGIAGAAERKVEFLAAGPTTHSGNVIILYWSHTVGANTSQFTWTFITPPEVSSFDMPKLPAIFDDTQPKPEDGVYPQFIAGLEIPSLTNGYDGMRALPEAELTCPACAVRLNLLPRVIYSGQLPNGPF
jgi:hypothetical protein